jgi:archaellum component FlaG (FlaF/FlaG flagellin family)
MESVQVKEVFILPAKPKTWVDEEGMSLPLQYDNKISVTQEVIKLENGTVSNSWCVVEGDPTGNHKIDVIINGVLAKSFRFTVGLKL